MKVVDTQPDVEGTKLPPPPDQEEDRVNDFGWLSRGPTRRAHRAAERAMKPLLLEDDQPSGLPPEPPEDPQLPDPPAQEPDQDYRGAKPDGIKTR